MIWSHVHESWGPQRACLCVQFNTWKQVPWTISPRKMCLGLRSLRQQNGTHTSNSFGLDAKGIENGHVQDCTELKLLNGCLCFLAYLFINGVYYLSSSHFQFIGKIRINGSLKVFVLTVQFMLAKDPGFLYWVMLFISSFFSIHK